jgi:mono/diheme cytochrome c family protein
MLRGSRVFNRLAVAALCSPFFAVTVRALPFNDDMVSNQMRTGVVMRQKMADSIPVGSLDYHFAKKEDTFGLVNPKKGEADSSARGKRLFAVNCFPCHGDISAEPYQPGPVSQFMPGPNLAADEYSEKPANSALPGRSDGQIFGTIDFGNVLMPALGWKISPSEHWDIINYVRQVQAAKNKK